MKHMFWRWKILVESVSYAINSWRITSKGQLPEYEILQLSHRLEKGLMQENPKPRWGWDKAKRLALLLSHCKDEFVNCTGTSVLAAYLKSKEDGMDKEEVRMSEEFERNYGSFSSDSNRQGGTLLVSKSELMFSSEEVNTVVRLFNSRHSVRNYSVERVNKDVLMKAVNLAMRSPSACNRQTTHLYVNRIEEQQSIILTGNVRAFSVNEFNDWVVSTSIFAGYLTLALHLYGIGSCIMRKQQYGHPSFNEMIRKKCNIPEDEMIILEIRYGYYKDDNRVAVSNRRDGIDIVTFVDE